MFLVISMEYPQIKQVVGGGSKLLFLKRLFIFSSIFLLIFIVFINATIKSVENRSIKPFITDIGGRLLYTTIQLGKVSEKILNEGGIFDFGKGFFTGIWQFIVRFSDLFSNIILLYMWIKAIGWLSGKSFISDTSRWFLNYFIIAPGIFFTLQIFIFYVQ